MKNEVKFVSWGLEEYALKARQLNKGQGDIKARSLKEKLAKVIKLIKKGG